MRRLGWRCCVLFGRTIYLLSGRSAVSPVCRLGQGTGLERSHPPCFLSSIWLKLSFCCPQPSSQFSSYRLRDCCCHQGVLQESQSKPQDLQQAAPWSVPSSTPGSFNLLTAIFHLANFRTSLHERDGASRGRWLCHYFSLIYYFLEISLEISGTDIEWQKEVLVSHKSSHCAFM